MTDRVILGALPSGAYGARISKPGYDVKTCSDYDLLFADNFNTIRTIEQGSLYFPKGANTSVTSTVYFTKYIPSTAGIWMGFNLSQTSSVEPTTIYELTDSRGILWTKYSDRIEFTEPAFYHQYYYVWLYWKVMTEIG